MQWLAKQLLSLSEYEPFEGDEFFCIFIGIRRDTLLQMFLYWFGLLRLCPLPNVAFWTDSTRKLNAALQPANVCRPQPPYPVPEDSSRPADATLARSQTPYQRESLEPTWIDQEIEPIEEEHTPCSETSYDESYYRDDEDDDDMQPEPYTGWYELQQDVRWCGCGAICLFGKHSPGLSLTGDEIEFEISTILAENPQGELYSENFESSMQSTKDGLHENLCDMANRSEHPVQRCGDPCLGDRTASTEEEAIGRLQVEEGNLTHRCGDSSWSDRTASMDCQVEEVFIGTDDEKEQCQSQSAEDWYGNVRCENWADETDDEINTGIIDGFLQGLGQEQDPDVDGDDAKPCLRGGTKMVQTENRQQAVLGATTQASCKDAEKQDSELGITFHELVEGWKDGSRNPRQFWWQVKPDQKSQELRGGAAGAAATAKKRQLKDLVEDMTNLIASQEADMDDDTKSAIEILAKGLTKLKSKEVPTPETALSTA